MLNLLDKKEKNQFNTKNNDKYKIQHIFIFLSSFLYTRAKLTTKPVLNVETPASQKRDILDWNKK